MSSFSYTVLAQLRAMEEGVAFAQSYGDSESSSRYKAVADEMNETLESFWDAERGYLTATINGEPMNGLIPSNGQLKPES